MICPKCKAEYVAGFTRCSDCQVPLVDALPEPADRAQKRTKPGKSKAPLERLELETVLKSGDPGLVMLAESLLQSADIPFMPRGGISTTVAGWGGLAGENRPVELLVNRVDAEQARALLADLDAYIQEGEAAGDNADKS
jgi:hypothetical protein